MIDAAIHQRREPDALPIASWREKAGSLQGEADRRVKTGYVWAAYFLVVFGLDAWHAGNGMERSGALFCMLAAIFLAYQWRRFAAGAVLYDLPVLQFLSAYRDELLRQQRLARSGVVLAVVPLVCGISITAAGHLAAHHRLHAASFATVACFAALMLAAGWLLTHLQSQQIQFRIDEVETALRDAA